jgi:phage gp46-like protein
VSRQAGQRTGQQAGRRATTKDTSGARECGWWMDGDLVSVWGWEIGSLETTRWRRDRSVPNVMLRACDWCDGAHALLEDARVCSNGHVTASIVQQCESASLVIVADGRQQTGRERHCRRAHSHASQSKDVEHFHNFHPPAPTLSSGLGLEANAAPARHLLQPHSRQQDAVAVPQRPARM